MATLRGRSEVSAYIRGLPERLAPVLRGAARAGANVVADEIKVRTPSSHVRENIRIRTEVEAGTIRVRIDVKKRWARSIGIWLEYGTSPHFISVDDSIRMGMSVGRINRQHKAGSIVINGNFVGKAVHHPGSRPVPAFRPALDSKQAEAIAAAQKYINSHVRAGGVAAIDEAAE